MFTTDDDCLIVVKDGKPFGWIQFIYGNDGYDVISDYTGGKDFEADLKSALDEADRCEAGEPEKPTFEQLREAAKLLPPMDHYIVMTMGWPGYWGRGKTVPEAIKAARYLTEGRRVRIIACDADSLITEMGELQYNHRHVIGSGKLSRGGKIVDLVFGSDAV